MRSRSAFRSWGERPPAALAVCFRDDLVESERHAWLRGAEVMIRTLDHKAFTSGSFHVIDGRDVGMAARGSLGFSVGAHLHDLARAYLPRRARNPVAAVVVNIEAVARVTVDSLCGDRRAASGRVRAAVAAIAAHEYAHHVVALLNGDRLPSTASIEGTVGQLKASGPDKAHNATKHGAAWCRCYAHLVTRASFVPERAVWLERFRDDVRAATSVDPDAIIETLRSELSRYSIDDALVNVLRTPAPGVFLNLFDQGNAVRSAEETTNYARSA